MDSCYNAPAISSAGVLNPGRDTCGAVTSPSDGCREPGYLEVNNVYVRTRCNSGWCAHLYGYYFEVDAKEKCKGHRHDWEHIVVWTENGVAKYVAASAHGSYEVRPSKDTPWNGDHPKIVYHKDGSSTHAFRFAQGGRRRHRE
ncbi:hypothetical protein ACCO45_009895 [Purpureocillium lilacinum]|uniref:Uncharacterized protein n=1 Tax=Purpureocillium lilacinum TaxID=33203 RepID=A0ACC4DHJ2_PURLI